METDHQNGKNSFSRTVILSELTSMEPLTIRISRTWDRKNRKRVTQLSEGLIPHTSHARPFIYLILLCYKTREAMDLTVNQICEMAYIAPSTLYRWKDRYLQDFYRWYSQYLAIRCENGAVSCCLLCQCQTLEIFRNIIPLYHTVVEKIQLFFSSDQSL